MKKVVFILSIVLTSCSSFFEPPSRYVQGNIESFSNFEGGLNGSIYIEAGSDDKKGKLEFISYKNRLKANLMNTGLQFTDDLSSADYVLFLDYGIGNEKIRIGSYSVPTFGPTGGGTTTFYGNTAYTTPNYGVTGSRTQNFSYSEYPRFVTLDIFKLNSQKKIYEMTLKSKGSCGLLSEVIDEFFVAISKDFPNNSGSFRVPAIFDC